MKNCLDALTKCGFVRLPDEVSDAYELGDRVASLIEYADIKIGDVGTVIGHSVEEGVQRFQIDFGKDRSVANVSSVMIEHALL